MGRSSNDGTGLANTPVINLGDAPGERQAWERPALIVYLWGVIELVLVYNPWQISSKLRIAALRLFGAQIGSDVIMRPRLRVRFPWNLKIGDRCWIGEGAWIHNQDLVLVGHDVVISQEAFITTGSHALSTNMALLTKPVHIHDGAWIATRAIVLGGSTIGVSSVISPNTVVPPNTNIADNVVVGLQKLSMERRRFQL